MEARKLAKSAATERRGTVGDEHKGTIEPGPLKSGPANPKSLVRGRSRLTLAAKNKLVALTTK